MIVNDQENHIGVLKMVFSTITIITLLHSHYTNNIDMSLPREFIKYLLKAQFLA